MASDAMLGMAVHNHLVKVGVETPCSFNKFDNGTREIIEANVKSIMEALGLDLSDDSMIDTPSRVAKMYVGETYYGLNYENFPKCTVVDNKFSSELVVVNDIEVYSSCEHHLVQIDGKATIAYIPTGKVLGLSKFNRIVDFFSRRPQVQERLTNQIWHALNYILGTDNLAVYIGATHYCVKSRGVKDSSSFTTTNMLGGDFRSHSALRAEFMNIARS